MTERQSSACYFAADFFSGALRALAADFFAGAFFADAFVAEAFFAVAFFAADFFAGAFFAFLAVAFFALARFLAGTVPIALPSSSTAPCAAAITVLATRTAAFFAVLITIDFFAGALAILLLSLLMVDPAKVHPVRM